MKNRFIIKYLYTIIFFFVFISISSQVSFPLNGKNPDDFTSAFGPRNVGDDNYDFHAAIDISANYGDYFIRVYIWNNQIYTFSINAEEGDITTLLNYKTTYFTSIQFN